MFSTPINYRCGDGKTPLSETRIAYDGRGLPVGYRDRGGLEKHLDRDVLGRIVREYFPDDTSAPGHRQRIRQVTFEICKQPEIRYAQNYGHCHDIDLEYKIAKLMVK